jgi:hypothetical protein
MQFLKNIVTTRGHDRICSEGHKIYHYNINDGVYMTFCEIGGNKFAISRIVYPQIINISQFCPYFGPDTLLLLNGMTIEQYLKLIDQLDSMAIVHPLHIKANPGFCGEYLRIRLPKNKRQITFIN